MLPDVDVDSQSVTQNALSIFQAEVDRAVVELRSALGEMAQECRLHPSLMSMKDALDRYEFHVIAEVGESSFILDDKVGAVAFRVSALAMVYRGARAILADVGIAQLDEAARVEQLCVNLFVAHEILHICQNFPDFRTVGAIKTGASQIGLPILDAAADTIAASICAKAEHRFVQGESEDDFLSAFVNMLILAYAIGTIVFDSRTKPEKRQRVLSLLVSAAMIQAKVHGLLNEEAVNVAWNPKSPLFLLNVEACGSFNAFVISDVPGILFGARYEGSPELALCIWNGVGKLPTKVIFQMVVQLLRDMGVIGEVT